METQKIYYNAYVTSNLLSCFTDLRFKYFSLEKRILAQKKVLIISNTVQDKLLPFRKGLVTVIRSVKITNYGMLV